MNKKSITYKLIITFTAITGSVLILIGMILSFWFNKDYVSERINVLEKQLSVIEQANIAYLNQSSETSYEELLKSMAMVEIATNMKSIILDNQGYVYAVSNEDLNSYKYSKVELSDEQFKKNESGKSERITFQQDGVELEVYSKSISYNDNLSGAILMIGSSKYIEAPNRIYVTIWMSVILALVLSSVIMYYFARKILIKPLEEINNAAKRLSRGDVEKRVNIESDDEIGELGESFNMMAASLEAVDIKRRDFISNVSHELRSPITSIKGFISGILDGVIPKDKENYYLNVVNEEVSRLSRLVNDLLDISSMESGKFKLKTVRVDINQIITLCILNLESKIKSKMMNVEIVFHDKYEYAIGDRDRLIQVVTNLIENAIKYGSEKGEIKIDTYTKGDKVYVNVFNSGPNLSKEELSSIWDRFYKSDKSRTNKISTGLGLSIVRLIITQHGQDVWANNIESKGVNFTFTLEKA